MNIPAIVEDLIKYFREERECNAREIEATDQLVTKIKKPAAYRFFQTGFSLFLELLLWIAVVACLGAIIFMERLYPFSLINHISAMQIDGITPHELNVLTWSTRGLFLIMALCFFWISRLLAGGRKRNKVLSSVTKEVQVLMQQLLQRRSINQALTTKYPVDLAEEDDSIATPKTLNPGNQTEPDENNPDDIPL